MPGSLAGAGPPPGGASLSGLACPAHFVFNFSYSTKGSRAVPVRRTDDDLCRRPVEGVVPQCTVRPDTNAGDVIIFSGMGTGHGVGRWRSDHQRRLVIMGYASRHMDMGHYGHSGHLRKPPAARAKPKL